jgi:hypothetical protein
MENKNIWLLPTKKMSRLYLRNGVLKMDNSGFNLQLSYQNIYITSDEEIKVGDWCINLNSSYEHKELCRIDNQIELERYAQKIGNDCKKIILTTDPDLIEDGVQSIDDEFLEWFVKNPSCEYVTVCDVVFGESRVWKKYIIIPKEKPKQFSMNADLYENHGIVLPELPKQETLEQAANRLFYTVGNEGIASIDSFMKGAKWQAERMYSEEEVIDLLQKMNDCPTTFEGRIDIREWFEQHKKK